MDVNEFFMRFVLPPALLFVLLFGAFKWTGTLTLGQEYVTPVIKSANFVLEHVFNESTMLQSKPSDGVRVVNALGTDDNLFVAMSASSTQLLLLALMVAFMATWPASIVQKILGILFGSAFFYGLDVARVVFSLLIEIYIPLWFDLFKHWVFPILFTTLNAAYIVIWLVLTGGLKTQQPAETEA